MSKRVKKLASRRGFTMTELLVAVLIMALSTIVITRTLALGIRQVKARTRDSEAEILCNNLSEAVRDQLAYATDVNKVATAAPAFRSSAATLPGEDCVIRVDNDDHMYFDYGLGTYYPVSASDYAKYGAALQATVEYRYDNAANIFYVTITVSNDENMVNEHKNEFIVQPLLDELDAL